MVLIVGIAVIAFGLGAVAIQSRRNSHRKLPPPVTIVGTPGERGPAGPPGSTVTTVVRCPSPATRPPGADASTPTTRPAVPATTTTAAPTTTTRPPVILPSLPPLLRIAEACP